MKYTLYESIENRDDLYENIYVNKIETKNKKEIEEEINKLKEKCSKNPSYEYGYRIIKKLF